MALAKLDGPDDDVSSVHKPSAVAGPAAARDLGVGKRKLVVVPEYNRQ